jgi:8-oxo-dGTP pyrophosphatase MutT (NUDIX family)
MKSLIKELLKESLDKIIKCKKCGWTWKKSESGPDMYFCHKCGHDNTPNNIKEEKKDGYDSSGVLIKCTKTDRVFLLLRNDEEPKWSLVSGMLKEDESPLTGLKREIKEELSIDPSIIKFVPVTKEFVKFKDMNFYYYEGFTSEEFTPKLDDENLKFGWFSKDDLPSPLYLGMERKINNIWQTSTKQ